MLHVRVFAHSNPPPPSSPLAIRCHSLEENKEAAKKWMPILTDKLCRNLAVGATDIIPSASPLNIARPEYVEVEKMSVEKAGLEYKTVKDTEDGKVLKFNEMDNFMDDRDIQRLYPKAETVPKKGQGSAPPGYAADRLFFRLKPFPIIPTTLA